MSVSMFVYALVSVGRCVCTCVTMAGCSFACASVCVGVFGCVCGMRYVYVFVSVSI